MQVKYTHFLFLLVLLAVFLLLSACSQREEIPATSPSQQGLKQEELDAIAHL